MCVSDLQAGDICASSLCEINNLKLRKVRGKGDGDPAQSAKMALGTYVYGIRSITKFHLASYLVPILIPTLVWRRPLSNESRNGNRDWV